MRRYFLNHVVLLGLELRDVEHKHEYYDEFVKILNEFCDKNKINYDEVLRVCVNFTYHNGKRLESDIACRSEFEHEQLIVYLNQPMDRQSFTVVLDENESKIVQENIEVYLLVRLNIIIITLKLVIDMC